MSQQPGPAPQQGGAVEVLLSERASATPCAHLAPLPLPPRREASEPLRASVRALQEWFQQAISHPGELEEGVLASPLLPEAGSLDRVVTHGPRLHALRRLGIYHHSYRARLIECLADDYPTLQRALGEEAFASLCLAYIARHPSASPSLNFFGRHMARFCRERGDAPEPFASLRGFCADLAALEWALVEVLHAPEAPALSPEALSRIAPERWGDARLPPSQAARLLRFDFPVNTYFQGVRDETSPGIPALCPSAAVVYRQGYILWRMNLTPIMADLLGALFAGASLGEALGAVPTPEGDEAAAELEQSVMRWFGEWVRGGLFAGVELA